MEQYDSIEEIADGLRAILKDKVCGALTNVMRHRHYDVGEFTDDDILRIYYKIYPQIMKMANLAFHKICTLQSFSNYYANAIYAYYLTNDTPSDKYMTYLVNKETQLFDGAMTPLLIESITSVADTTKEYFIKMGHPKAKDMHAYSFITVFMAVQQVIINYDTMELKLYLNNQLNNLQEGNL